jgi:hypothetical protein
LIVITSLYREQNALATALSTSSLDQACKVCARKILYEAVFKRLSNRSVF